MAKEYETEGMSKKDFMSAILEFNPQAKVDLINKAYDFSEQVHKGQKRESGDDYFMHLREVAYILAGLKLDSQTIAAGLLHDCIEDTKTKPAEIKKVFGSEVMNLVGGVTKMNTINVDITDEEKAENVRKILLATTKDIRVMLIKLADRLHNMRTLKYLPKTEQKAIAKETQEIYIPVAYKLGMYRMKSELEDLCLRFLQLEIYQELKNRVAKKKAKREKEVKHIVKAVKRDLAKNGLEAVVYGRAKNFASIYRKMQRKNISFEEVRDLSAIRIIVKEIDDCYRALGIIHSTWTPIINRFDDYIATPKPNMYQSLHTEIIFGDKPVEVQIRTREMHHIAEEGIAAHWRYQGTERDKRFDRAISWLKQILDWKKTKDARQFIETLKVNLFKDEIFVFTPKGDPIPLPEKATPIDFAYMVHTDIGNHAVGAKVNNTQVSLDSELEPGNVVEIITSRNTKPSRSWLKFVKTGAAKAKIRQALGIPGDDSKKETYVAKNILDEIETRGFKKSALRMSKCCNPSSNEPIMGYRTKDGKIAVHKADCDHLKILEENRKIKINWKEEEKPLIRLQTEIVDRVGLLAEILNVFAREMINIESVNTKTSRNKMFIIFELKETPILKEIIPKIKNIRNVVSVKII